MATSGDSYTVTLKPSHVDWGAYRNTSSRDIIPGEGYIPIPRYYAATFYILNQNGTGYEDILGKNIFRCTSSDGFFTGELRAQGASDAGNIYAKQFSENGNLKGIGAWFQHVNAIPGDQIKVSWTSPYDIIIEKL